MDTTTDVLAYLGRVEDSTADEGVVAWFQRHPEVLHAIVGKV